MQHLQKPVRTDALPSVNITLAFVYLALGIVNIWQAIAKLALVIVKHTLVIVNLALAVENIALTVAHLALAFVKNNSFPVLLPTYRNKKIKRTNPTCFLPVS